MKNDFNIKYTFLESMVHWFKIEQDSYKFVKTNESFDLAKSATSVSISPILGSNLFVLPDPEVIPLSQNQAHDKFLQTLITLVQDISSQPSCHLSILLYIIDFFGSIKNKDEVKEDESGRVIVCPHKDRKHYAKVINNLIIEYVQQLLSQDWKRKEGMVMSSY